MAGVVEVVEVIVVVTVAAVGLGGGRVATVATAGCRRESFLSFKSYSFITIPFHGVHNVKKLIYVRILEQ